MKRRFLLAFGAFLVGCAANSGVVPMGPDTFMVSRQAATGFSGLGNLKAEALQEAGQYCSKKKQSLEVTDTKESQPPYVFGNFPRVEVYFRCVEAKK